MKVGLEFLLTFIAFSAGNGFCLSSLRGSLLVKSKFDKFPIRRTESTMLTDSCSNDIMASLKGLLPLSLGLDPPPEGAENIIDDPTAGMSQDQIDSYVNNIGGGLCNYPESIKSFIGLALNLSLLAFGVTVVAYAIANILVFVFQRRVDDSLKEVEKEARLAGYVKEAKILEAMRLTRNKSSFGDDPSRSRSRMTEIMSEIEELAVDDDGEIRPMPVVNSGPSTSGTNRQERRLKNRLKE